MLLWCSGKYLSPTGEINVFYAAAVILVVGTGPTSKSLSCWSIEWWDRKSNRRKAGRNRWSYRYFVGCQVFWSHYWSRFPSKCYMGNGLRSFCLGDGSKSFAILVWLWSLRYKLHKPDGSSSGIILRVLMAARHNWSRNYPRTEKGFYWKNH